MQETKDMKYFEDAMASLIQMQNTRRDKVLELVARENFPAARSVLANMETITTAVRLCEQTIKRHIQYQEEINKKLQEAALAAQASNEEKKE